MAYRGRLLVIEGLDGSGKESQSKALLEVLKTEGYDKVAMISLPEYGMEHSGMVEEYLKGNYSDRYGKHPMISITYIKQIAMMYAMNRVCAVIRSREEYAGRSVIDLLKEGYLIICDRYTSSSIVNLTPKIYTDENRTEFIKWSQWEEYKQLGVPKPSRVIFLDVSIEQSLKNIEKRGLAKDIHENISHLSEVNNLKEWIIRYCKWDYINCMKDNDTMRSLGDIHRDIYKVAKELLEEITLNKEAV